jgi:hypothetical protein
MNTLTMTDDELHVLPLLPAYTIYGPNGAGSYFSGHTDEAMIAYARAVLALAEQRHAAKVAGLEAAERQRNVFAQQANEYAEEARALRARLAELEAAHTEAKIGLAKIYGMQAPAATEEAAQPAQVAAPNAPVILLRAGPAWSYGYKTEIEDEDAMLAFVQANPQQTIRFAPEGTKVAAPAQADGWVMLDKRGLVHQERWWKWDFFGGIETREGFTPADVDNACREWPGLAPFTVVPVFLAAAPKREGGA